MVGTFLLVHGGWHAAWCWQRLTPLLTKAGHTVLAPDLPAHGQDPTPRAELTTDSYAARLRAVLDETAQPAVLVGHSSGGMLITELASTRPGHVRGLVYLSAFLLTDGTTPPEIMREDTESLLLKYLQVDQAAGISYLTEEHAREAFFHDCSPADARWATSSLEPEPLPDRFPPSSTVVQRYDIAAIPRWYVACQQDRALSP